MAEAVPGALRNPDFRKFWIGETVSLFGSEVTRFVLPLVAVLTLGASAFEVGVLNALRYVPIVIVSLFAGIWLDRRRRLPVLIGSNVVRAACIGLVPLLATLGGLTMWTLGAVALVLGTFTVIFDVGSLSLVPNLVDRPQLPDANGRLQTSFSAAMIVGPGVGGFLVTAMGAPLTLSVNAASYAFSVVMLLLLTVREPEPQAAADRPTVRASIAEGLHAVFGNRVLRNLLSQSATFNLAQNAMMTVFVIYTVRYLGLTAGELGLVLGIGSLGALAERAAGHPDHPRRRLRPIAAPGHHRRRAGTADVPARAGQRRRLGRAAHRRVRHGRLHADDLQHQHRLAAPGGHPEPAAGPDERELPDGAVRHDPAGCAARRLARAVPGPAPGHGDHGGAADRPDRLDVLLPRLPAADAAERAGRPAGRARPPPNRLPSPRPDPPFKRRKLMLSDSQRAALAARLRQGRGTTTIPRRDPNLAELPLSSGQEQLWFIDQFAPGLPTYNVAGTLNLDGDLDTDALGRAFDALVARHEILRTRIDTVDGSAGAGRRRAAGPGHPDRARPLRAVRGGASGRVRRRGGRLRAAAVRPGEGSADPDRAGPPGAAPPRPAPQRPPQRVRRLVLRRLRP
nr:hypothetical protein GCM10020092_076440 [Actinoplanes digitatis]